MDAIRKLANTAAVLGNLPEKPGTNGSVLLIDDEETARCVADIDAAILEVAALRKELEEWRKLRDPVTLHANLLRGLPAKLDRATFLHLAGDDAAVGAAQRSS